MTTYYNHHADAIIRAIDCAQDTSGVTCALHIASEEHLAQAKAWTEAIDGVDVLTESHQGNTSLLIIHSKKPEADVLAALKAQGQTLELPVKKIGIEPWKGRAIASVTGQTLQLVSSWKGSKNASDSVAIAGFAVTNLIANAVNYVFGKQEKEDPHQLRYLKEHLNQEYQPHLSPGQFLLDPDAKRLSFRAGQKEESGLSHQTYDMLKRNSVLFSELGLRAIGAASLCFPITKWKEGMRMFSRGNSAKEILRTISNENAVTFKVGVLTLIGKALVGISKEADPYNPKPSTTIDKIREKVTFPLSSIVEGYGSSWMAYDRLKNQRFTHNGKSMPDYPGALGNAVFTGSYAFRLMAPYGTRDVNMKELYAHISDSLAKMPKGDIPSVLADTAVELSQHFKGQETPEPTDIASIYAGLATDLKEYHHIDLLSSTPSHAAEPPKERSFASQHAPKPHAADDLKPHTSHEHRLQEELPANAILGAS